MPVVGNLLNTRERIAQGLGIAREDLHALCLDALRNPIAPVSTLPGSSRCRHGSSARPRPISPPE
jgi:3-polyprenyl-4-hydroxybenzoate decarboxylase